MISIVMAYYNRQAQLGYTLKTISQSSCKDVEVIIVDDFSAEDEQPEPICAQYPELDIKIIHMRDQVDKKYYCNPCIPYNTGFKATTGDKIIIQNPECCHMGDVLAYTAEHLTDDVYLTFHDMFQFSTRNVAKPSLMFLSVRWPQPLLVGLLSQYLWWFQDYHYGN